MLQQLEAGGTTFFKCPANNCGNWLKHEQPGPVLGVEGQRIIREPRVGVAPCGASVCLVCHLEIPRTWETASDVSRLRQGLHVRAYDEGSNEYRDAKVVELSYSPPGAKAEFKGPDDDTHDSPFFELAHIQVKTDDYLHVCKEDIATSDEINQQALKETLAAMEAFGCKACPHCGCITQKSWGCNYMRCQKCGGEWCWETGLVRRGPSPPA